MKYPTMQYKEPFNIIYIFGLEWPLNFISIVITRMTK